MDDAAVFDEGVDEQIIQVVVRGKQWSDAVPDSKLFRLQSA